LKEFGRIIGIDVGTKRIGLARTDLLRISANPAGTFAPEEIFVEIKAVKGDYPVHAFVVGWPLSTSGEESGATEMVEKFIKKLKKNFPSVPVYKVDERYTSVQAVQTMVNSGVPRKKRREKSRVDQTAAAIILQKFLEMNKDD
jgi:putative holliday junction resolvase